MMVHFQISVLRICMIITAYCISKPGVTATLQQLKRLLARKYKHHISHFPFAISGMHYLGKETFAPSAGPVQQDLGNSGVAERFLPRVEDKTEGSNLSCNHEGCAASFYILHSLPQVRQPSL